MRKGRLEAFSDGVIAILITIMVLGLVPPKGTSLEDLAPLVPVFLAYVLSFFYLGIYWNNHHHLLQVARTVDGRVLWANLFLLFWLSLVPFTTAWMGETGFAAGPTAAYGLVLLMCAVGYYVLVRALIACQPPGSPLSDAIGDDRKGTLSTIAGAVGIPVALVAPPAAMAVYVGVALAWVIPDPRMERALIATDDPTVS